MVQAIGRGSSGELLTAICMLFEGGLHAVNLQGNLIGFSFQKLHILRFSTLEKQSLGSGFCKVVGLPGNPAIGLTMT